MFAVCDMLDRLYTAFDGIARKHEVFKVETIGAFNVYFSKGGREGHHYLCWGI